MNANQAVGTLAALAHEHRLRIYRLLIQAGPEGLSAGAMRCTFRKPGESKPAPWPSAVRTAA